MVAVALVTIVPALLALIHIGSPSVFEDVVSLSTSGLYASYLIPCSLLLWRRTTGRMEPHVPDSDDGEGYVNYVLENEQSKGAEADVAQPHLRWGPWRLPGLLGIINNVYAIVYILFVLFWSFWPPDFPATPQNMNYSVLVTGVVIIFSVVYYYLKGKSSYMGPLIEREVKEHAVRKI